MADYTQFTELDIRVGTIIKAVPFPNARKPAYQLEIDFGPLGIKKSSAQITNHYTLESLLNKQIVAVVNFPVKQIGNFYSECLVLGVYDSEDKVVLLKPDFAVSNGNKIG